MDYLKLKELKQAKTRCWGIWLGHLALAPVASVAYAAKTENWAPTLIATGIALVGIPLAVFDVGITTGIVAPVTSAAMLSNKVQQARRKQKFLLPEQAEAAYYKEIGQ